MNMTGENIRETVEQKDSLKEIMTANREILETLRFFRNYLRWRIIWSSVKWLIFIAVIVFGFVSLKSLTAYFQSYLDSFRPDTVQSASQFDVGRATR